MSNLWGKQERRGGGVGGKIPVGNMPRGKVPFRGASKGFVVRGTQGERERAECALFFITIDLAFDFLFFFFLLWWQTGELLASRLYGKGKEQMDYCLVATAVFTPVSLLLVVQRPRVAHPTAGATVGWVTVEDFAIIWFVSLRGLSRFVSRSAQQ